MEEFNFDSDRSPRERPLNLSPDAIYRPRARRKKTQAAFYAKALTVSLFLAVALGVIYGISRNSPHEMLSICLLAIGLFIYFIPTLIAIAAGHVNLTAVIVLNILLGWTFIGWVAALVWACMESQRRN